MYQCWAHLLSRVLLSSSQDESGASRDEMAAALMEVAGGRNVNDRITLKALWKEMTQWAGNTEVPRK